MNRLLLLSLLLLLCWHTEMKATPTGDFYELRIYQVEGVEQEKLVDAFLREAYVPALHRFGISKVGVFKPVEQDTAYFGKRIYVLIPFNSLNQFTSLPDALLKDKTFQSAGKNYIDAPYNAPPYARFESILLKAFKDMPKFRVPELKSPAADRVYELRSYEGHTEKIYKNKEKMFNEGGEIVLFQRLAFNAVFYAEVLAGPRKPNLMYMTSFSDMASREAHWKTFRDDPEWKRLSSMPEYQNNVSKINIYLLHPTDYSDI